MTSFTSPSTVEPEVIATDPAPPEDEEDGHHQRWKKDAPSRSHRQHPAPPPPPDAELFADVEALRMRLSSSSSDRKSHGHDQRRGDGEGEGEGEVTCGGTEVTPGRLDGDHHDDGGVGHDVPSNFTPTQRLTVLDCTPRNVLNFAQGEWDMVRRDLLLSGIDVEAVDALGCNGGPCETVVAAFRLRRELVHYKKVCLHLFQEGRGDVERRLRRAAAFHHVADPRDDGSVVAGMLAHFEALRMNDEEDWVEKKIADISEEGVKEEEEECDRYRRRNVPRSPRALLERKRLLVASSRALSRHRGAIRAVHDARDVVKAICMTPRHPDDDALRPEKLTSLPGSMYVHQACETAEAALSAGCLRRRSSLRGHVRGSKEERNLSSAREEGDDHESHMTSTSHGDDEGHHPQSPPPGLSALDLAVRRSRDELSWPEGAASFLRMSLVARGGYKALAMAEELASYETHLGDLVVRCESLLRRFRDVHESCVAAVMANDGRVGADDLSAAVRRDMHVQILTGALGICRENSRWISAINDIMRRSVSASLARDTFEHPARQQSPSSRLFVTRDDVPSNRACSFVPRDFAMGSFLATSRHVLEHTLEPAMREAVATEGWPPGEWTGRTRVRTLSAASSPSSSSSSSTTTLGTLPSTTGAGVDSSEGGRRVADAGVKKEEKKKKKPRQYHPCRSCGCTFLDGVWVRLGLCAVCEDAQRRSVESGGGGGCIFDCGLSPGSFCPHSGRCFSCDAPHSCEVGCRMSRGNGEVAAALVESMRPSLLLIDFDRTLSSTKSGASPLLTGRRVERRAKSCDGAAAGGAHGGGDRGSRGHQHTVDDELKAAVLAQRDFGVAHVITRNSHRSEIERFLSMNGMADLARNVHIVPKKKSKGAFIRERFYPCESGDGSPDEESTGSADKTCLFIDDDIRELVADPWLVGETRMHRLLFDRIMT